MRFAVAVLALLIAVPPPVHADPTVIPAARAAIGKPYVWGAAGPDAFDCSGLVVWAYAQIGVQLPHSSQALAVGGQPIDRADLAPGDVIAYNGAKHVALYSGDGDVIHASTYGHPVTEVPIDAAGLVYSIRRYSD